MRDITYCSHTDCCDKECYRHQCHALADRPIIIADLNDGYCFISENINQAVNELNMRQKLLMAICKGTQKTNYKCDEVCRAMCGSDGSCAYCSIIADAIEEVLQ